MKKAKQFYICVEGVDKTNKSLLCSYIWYLSKYKNVQMYDRGMISSIAYNKLYKRNLSIDTSIMKSFKFVFLTTEKPDWKIKCKLSNEPEINFEKNIEAFNDAKNLLLKEGYSIYEYNVSTDGSIYQIAQKIINDLHINDLVEENE